MECLYEGRQFTTSTDGAGRDLARTLCAILRTRLLIMHVLVLGSLAGRSAEAAEVTTADESRESVSTEADTEETRDPLVSEAEELLKIDEATREIERRVAVNKSVSSLPPGEPKTTLLKRLSQYFSNEEDFPEARKAALAIDSPQLEERARTLVLIADAERLAHRPQQAWWSLHEAQQVALKLENAETMVGVFREIGRVETLLRSEPNKLKSVSLEPNADSTIRAILEDGLPPVGHREIDILRKGGGPFRDPMLIQHTYYFNGKRFYQGPVFRGGPTIVQVTHPITGCPACVSLNMPSGAPIIQHKERSIQYSFPEVCLRIEFKRCGGCDVEYHHLCNNYNSLRRSLAKRSATATPSAFGSTNSTSEAISRAAKTLAGPPSNLASRLPVISDLFGGGDKRIPNTLRVPGQ
jgi:hypothetical protein